MCGVCEWCDVYDGCRVSAELGVALDSERKRISRAFEYGYIFLSFCVFSRKPNPVFYLRVVLCACPFPVFPPWGESGASFCAPPPTCPEFVPKKAQPDNLCFEKTEDRLLSCSGRTKLRSRRTGDGGQPPLP